MFWCLTIELKSSYNKILWRKNVVKRFQSFRSPPSRWLKFFKLTERKFVFNMFFALYAMESLRFSVPYSYYVPHYHRLIIIIFLCVLVNGGNAGWNQMDCSDFIKSSLLYNIKANLPLLIAFSIVIISPFTSCMDIRVICYEGWRLDESIGLNYMESKTKCSWLSTLSRWKLKWFTFIKNRDWLINITRWRHEC